MNTPPPTRRTGKGLVRILLFVGSWAVVAVVAFLWYRSTLGPGDGQPEPLPVREGDTEVVWLFPATSTSAWHELVKAVGKVREVRGLAPSGADLTVERERAFPQETTAVPEVALRLSVGDSGRRLVFRWYKLTSNWNSRDWATALVSPGRPPPFAFIGGSNSNQARELACALRAATDAAGLPEGDRPWLLLTEATADVVNDCPVPFEEELAAEGGGGAGGRVRLNEIYPGRTRRLCFTNRQMAEAVTRFLWNQPDLRPNREPIVAASWNDDSYSRDLVDGFADAIRGQIHREGLRECGGQAGTLVGLWRPPTPWAGLAPLQRAAEHARRWHEPNIITLPIDSSVGEFLLPNQFEERAVQALLVEPADDAAPLTGMPRAQEGPPRQLLVVGGQTRPTRRFLRTLASSAPLLARRIVVASGDVLSFNTVYRDRRVQWPIQELPFPLVFFCHFNPVDRDAGFRPLSELPGWKEPKGEGPRDPWTVARVTTGTEEILLYREIVKTLVREWLDARGGLRGGDRSPLFDDDGNRRPGTGEYVVCVRPRFQDRTAARVLPEATVEVWPARPEGLPWECLERLTVHYGDVISPMAVSP
jgi:hypothetical protein